VEEIDSRYQVVERRYYNGYVFILAAAKELPDGDMKHLEIYLQK
jgi:hypothetical protein